MGVNVIFDKKKLPEYVNQSVEKTCYFWQRKNKNKGQKELLYVKKVDLI